jgi:hypothetical protein
MWLSPRQVYLAVPAVAHTNDGVNVQAQDGSIEL